MAITRSKFLGRGLSFPLRIAPDGGFAKDIETSRIVQSCINIILLHRVTRDQNTGNFVGERVWRPDFGTELGVLKHEPNEASTYLRVERALTIPIRKFEPRIKDLIVDIRPAPTNKFMVGVSLSYKLISSNEPGNLVFPLFLS